MNNEHPIADEVLDLMTIALSKGQNWIAYNHSLYFIDKEDVHFFPTKEDAYEFSENNISDRDSFNVIRFDSLLDIYKQIPYPTKFEERLIDPDINGLYNKNGNYFTDALIEYLEETQIINNKNFIIMNDKNYEYLTDQLKRAGFGDTLNNDLRKSIEKQNAEFTLNMQQGYGTDKVSAILHFKKSAESDMFFFNKYDLELKKENDDNKLKQTFYPDKNITLKEGYNLLDGRAVHKTLTTKEDEKFKAWLQLDFTKNTQSGNYQFKQYHQNWGFDLNKTLEKYPIKELKNEQYKANLIRSLERGNLQSATFELNGKEQKIYLTPNPNFKSLNAFDENKKSIKLSELMQNSKQEQLNKQDNKQIVSEKQSSTKEGKVSNEKDKPVKKKVENKK